MPLLPCKHCKRTKCYCCPECGCNIALEDHKPTCPMNQSKVCKACSGLKVSSKGGPCIPCAGTGQQSAGKVT